MIAWPSSLGRVNCGQWPVGRSMYSTSWTFASSCTYPFSLLDHLPKHRARELTRDDSDRHPIAALVGELLRITRDMDGRRNGTLAESRAQLLIEVDEVFLVEERPIRQRHIAVVSWERIIDHIAVAKGNAVHVHDAGDTVRPRIDRGMGDRTAAGVSDEYDLAVGRLEGVDHCDDRIDVITQSDLGAVGVLRFHPGNVSAWVRCPACCSAGTTSFHDEPSSHKPGIRTMSIARG